MQSPLNLGALVLNTPDARRVLRITGGTVSLCLRSETIVDVEIGQGGSDPGILVFSPGIILV